MCKLRVKQYQNNIKHSMFCLAQREELSEPFDIVLLNIKFNTYRNFMCIFI